jgi:hypothetical protein
MKDQSNFCRCPRSSVTCSWPLLAQKLRLLLWPLLVSPHRVCPFLLPDWLGVRMNVHARLPCCVAAIPTCLR